MFTTLARHAAQAMGSPTSFAVAACVILAWMIAGPFLGYSTAWQLFANTGTTILTVLAVFLIQHNQNKESRAIQLKLDELIASTKDARNTLIHLEASSEEDMEQIHKDLMERRETEE